jgi:uncharacterized protein YbgA (DUF1722 family)
MQRYEWIFKAMSKLHINVHIAQLIVRNNEFHQTRKSDANMREGKFPIITYVTKTLEYIIEHPNNWLQESTTGRQEIQRV